MSGMRSESRRDSNKNMSDSYIVLIPEEVDHVPSLDARRRALELLRRFAPDAEAVKEEATPEVRFMDCGENFERVLCPACGAELDAEWWRDRVDEEMNAGCPLQPLEMPCCQTKANLNELKYEWSQGFARFSLEAMNPNIFDLTAEQVKALEAALGCRIRKILQHI
jgi:hypothetical protein